VSPTIPTVVFCAGALISLATSWVLVSRIERIGGRLGASEAMLGLLAALAADTPEISSAVSALTHHQQSVGVGVVLGSNVFNLAALLGLGALVAGRIALHRRVVVLEGAIGIWVAAVALLTALRLMTAAAGLVLVLTAFVPYVVLASIGSAKRGRRLATSRLRRWLGRAIAEEELELSVAIHPRRGRPVDVAIGLLALVVVVTASVAMERAASSLGHRFSVPDIVVGTVVLAVVTSLPNAVAAVYLARRGRGAASLSTALNSNAINVAAGLLLPAVVLGLAPASTDVALVASWSLGLTVLVMGFAYIQWGLCRSVGMLIVASYLAFVATVVATASQPSIANLATYLLPPVVVLAVAAVLVIRPQPNDSRVTFPSMSGSKTGPGTNGSAPGRVPGPRQSSLVANWSVGRLFVLAAIVSSSVAACDALLGRRLILMGLLIVGPCCALLTGRWMYTALASAWVLLLALLVAIPDGIWATTAQAAFMAAILLVSLAATVGAALIENQTRTAP
jgi:cation:H+ antiporter